MTAKQLLAGHIALIVQFATERLASDPVLASSLPRLDAPAELGALLQAENLRSVQSLAGDAPALTPAAWIGAVPAVSVVGFLRLLEQLEQESSGAPDYYESPAYLALEGLRRRAIRLLPGYDEAPWATAAGACLPTFH